MATKKRSKKLIEIEAIIVAYAMSRLDVNFLKQLSFKTWKAAFKVTGKRLGLPAASMKNLRDEFDPVHPNSRRGWHQRPLRPNRQRVLGEFCDASDEAVMEIVRRILEGDRRIEEVLTRPLAQAADKVSNVAERLRTGRLAEEYFLQNSEQICGLAPGKLLDVRMNACGFDFGVMNRETAIEVKGLKLTRGDILFTDKEWSQANIRRRDYWVVIIGDVDRQPCARVIEDPATSLKVKSSIRQQAVVSWRASVVV